MRACMDLIASCSFVIQPQIEGERGDFGNNTSN